MKPSLLAVILSTLCACSSVLRATGTELLAETLVAHCQRLAECDAIEAVAVPHCVATYIDLRCSGHESRCTSLYTLDATAWGYCLDGYQEQLCHAAVSGIAPTPCERFVGVLGW